MRDGVGEANFVGLLADWREITLSTEKGLATILGVVLDLAHALRTRRWKVFNALRKPEAVMVNFQPLDPAGRGTRAAGFTQVGEDLWRFGDHLEPEQRGDLEWTPQKLSFTIE